MASAIRGIIGFPLGWVKVFSDRSEMILDFGFWILDFGFWILDFGFWIVPVYRIQDSKFKIQNSKVTTQAYLKLLFQLALCVG
jgi:hypothetical protein